MLSLGLVTRKIRQKLAKLFYWPGMVADCKRWTRACPTCQKGNTMKRARAPLHPVPVIIQLWSKIAIYPLSGLTRTHAGYRFILTVMDLGSRYPVAFPLRKTTSQAVASCLTKLFATFGLPDQILSDNGSNLTSHLLSELLTSLNITQIKTTPYKPQSNGALERWHRDLKRMMSKLSTKDRRDWDLWLPHALFAARDTPHSSVLNCGR